MPITHSPAVDAYLSGWGPVNAVPLVWIDFGDGLIKRLSFRPVRAADSPDGFDYFGILTRCVHKRAHGAKEDECSIEAVNAFAVSPEVTKPARAPFTDAPGFKRYFDDVLEGNRIRAGKIYIGAWLPDVPGGSVTPGPAPWDGLQSLVERWHGDVDSITEKGGAVKVKGKFLKHAFNRAGLPNLTMGCGNMFPGGEAHLLQPDPVAGRRFGCLKDALKGWGFPENYAEGTVAAVFDGGIRVALNASLAKVSAGDLAYNHETKGVGIIQGADYGAAQITVDRWRVERLDGTDETSPAEGAARPPSDPPQAGDLIRCGPEPTFCDGHRSTCRRWGMNGNNASQALADLPYRKLDNRFALPDELNEAVSREDRVPSLQDSKLTAPSGSAGASGQTAALVQGTTTRRQVPALLTRDGDSGSNRFRWGLFLCGLGCLHTFDAGRFLWDGYRLDADARAGYLDGPLQLFNFERPPGAPLNGNNALRVADGTLTEVERLRGFASREGYEIVTRTWADVYQGIDDDGVQRGFPHLWNHRLGVETSRSQLALAAARIDTQDQQADSGSPTLIGLTGITILPDGSYTTAPTPAAAFHHYCLIWAIERVLLDLTDLQEEIGYQSQQVFRESPFRGPLEGLVHGTSRDSGKSVFRDFLTISPDDTQDWRDAEGAVAVISRSQVEVTQRAISRVVPPNEVEGPGGGGPLEPQVVSFDGSQVGTTAWILFVSVPFDDAALPQQGDSVSVQPGTRESLYSINGAIEKADGKVIDNLELLCRHAYAKPVQTHRGGLSMRSFKRADLSDALGLFLITDRGPALRHTCWGHEFKPLAEDKQFNALEVEWSDPKRSHASTKFTVDRYDAQRILGKLFNEARRQRLGAQTGLGMCTSFEAAWEIANLKLDEEGGARVVLREKLEVAGPGGPGVRPPVVVTRWLEQLQMGEGSFVTWPHLAWYMDIGDVWPADLYKCPSSFIRITGKETDWSKMEAKVAYRPYHPEIYEDLPLMPTPTRSLLEPRTQPVAVPYIEYVQDLGATLAGGKKSQRLRAVVSPGGKKS